MKSFRHNCCMSKCSIFTARRRYA